MKVRLVEVLQDEGRATVRYECSLGVSSASWGDPSIEPVVGDDYFIEFTFLDPIRLGENASVLPRAGRAAVGVCDSLAQVDGLVEEIDEDGIVALRLAPDCLALIESHPGVLEKGTWLRLRFPASRIELFAIGRGC
jgi:hypothetical protein